MRVLSLNVELNLFPVMERLFSIYIYFFFHLQIIKYHRDSFNLMLIDICLLSH